MSDTADLLIEIGAEELPPRALRRMAEGFAAAIETGLDARGVGHGETRAYATPRRLAVLVRDVVAAQPDREVVRRGPALAVAFDESGAPTRAALGFARSCGVEVDQLERAEEGEAAGYLVLRTTQVGETTPALLPALVAEAVERIPVPKRMRWADLDVEFSRPVHWAVLLFGESLVAAEVLGVGTGRMTRGHRFHHPEPIPLETPAAYAEVLETQGRVMVDLDARVASIRTQVEARAADSGGRAVLDEDLLEEVAALVEWPVAILGGFEERYLGLPEEVLVATMKGNQRYFPVVGEDGRLRPCFVTVANVESRDPDAVRRGNERVIRPRLADAAFFFETDLRVPLAEREPELDDVVFQERLGSLRDKSRRVSRLAGHVAIAMGLDPEAVRLARRAGQISRCDLVTEMVGEFPELQGIMGREYARRSGEPEPVALAIGELYRPRFAGDDIPVTDVGRALAIADRLDTLAGIFGIGLPPTGDRDPYALRRAALGVLRIMVEGELDLVLAKLVDAAIEGYGETLTETGLAPRIMDFMMDRLRGYFAERGVPASVFAAVLAREPARPYDFARRVQAVDAFRRLPEARSLVAASKRIQNILRQAGGEVADAVDEALLVEDAEWNLAAKLVALRPRVRDLLKAGDYTAALTTLAGLRDDVDAFFETVKVMADDERVRANRLALLNQIGELFLATADVSRLQD